MNLHRFAAAAALIALAGCSSAQKRPAPVQRTEPVAEKAPEPDDGRPKPMDRAAFRSFVQQLDETAGDAGKLALLKTALAYNWITTAMANVILDHVVYRQSKLDAVPILHPRILDKENSYRIIEKFTYREDKVKVQQMLLSGAPQPEGQPAAPPPPSAPPEPPKEPVQY